MSAYFVNFAKTGDPNGTGLAPSPVYDNQRPVLLFGNEEITCRVDPWCARLDVAERRAEQGE